MADAGALGRLLRPESIAIVGASDRIGPGFNAWRALGFVGFTGRVYLVNPNKRELFGRPTYPSLDALPDPVDAVFVAVPLEAALDAVRQAAARGAGGAAVLTSGFGEAGPAGARAQQELQAIAEAHGMAVCGPNCLGLINFAGRTALFGTSLPDAVSRGGVAAVVQSGSIGIALLNAARGIGLSYLITSGNEAVTAAADYLEFLVDDPEVTVVIAFLEQLRQPERFLAAARRAHALGKPVIVVKTGRSERGRQAVMAHTGAVAGSDQACDAALRAAGVIRVDSLDDLLETALLVSTVRERPRARGVALLSPSGGEIALAMDVAESAGLELPPAPGAAPGLAALLPEFAHAGNPLDLTWTGLYDPSVARRCVELLGAEAAVGTLVLLQDAPRGLGEQQATRYANLLRSVAEGAAAVGKPLVVVSNLSGEFHPAFEAAAREAGVPLLRGTPEGLFAVARFARWATGLGDEALPEYAAELAEASAEAARRLKGLATSRLPAEHEARRVLETYGVQGPREALAMTAGDAAEAADRIGYPVVLKGLVENLLHKTEAGLVRVGLRSRAEVEGAARGVIERARGLGSGRLLGLLVQEQVRPVAELLVGARLDPDFGPIVVVGGGGEVVELYRDVAVRLAPVAQPVALAMVGETRAGRLLGGWRGRPAGDVGALARTVVALSRLIADCRAEVAEVEINPLAVLEQGRGAVALDCLLVPSGRALGAEEPR